MVSQYPDTIVITVKTTATQSPTTGTWTAGTPTSYTLECRKEINSAGRKLTGADGTLIDYAFICYLPKMTTVIPIGASFVLNEQISGKVKGASNGQLNSRLWL